jgi:hypothetical protein
MAELSIGQIIKMVVAVSVLVVVIVGAIYGFRYVYGYFEDLGIIGEDYEEPDLKVEFYQELIREGEVIAIIDSEGYIVRNRIKSDYFVRNRIIEKDGFWYNPDVGKIDSDLKVDIVEGENNEILKEIEGSYLINRDFMKVKDE